MTVRQAISEFCSFFGLSESPGSWAEAFSQLSDEDYNSVMCLLRWLLQLSNFPQQNIEVATEMTDEQVKSFRDRLSRF